MYAFTRNDEKLFHFKTEGHWVAYIPMMLADISPEALDFLSTVDVLVMPGAKTMHQVIEKIEPRLLITYGDAAQEIAHALGVAETVPVPKYKLKDADLSSEKTGCIILG